MTKQLDNLISRYIQKTTGDPNTIMIYATNHSMDLSGVIIDIRYGQKTTDTTIIKDGHTYDDSVYTTRDITIRLNDLDGDF